MKFFNLTFVNTALSLMCAVMLLALPLAGEAQTASDAAFQIQAATTTTAITPAQIFVPELDLFAAVEKVEQTAEGGMDTPEDWRNVGWFAPGFMPGEAGHAAFAGHLDWAGNEGPFWGLENVSIGSLLALVGENGRIFVYIVDSNRVFGRSDNVLMDVFGYSDKSRISLITCEGDFLDDDNTYNERRVVEGELLFVTQ